MTSPAVHSARHAESSRKRSRLELANREPNPTLPSEGPAGLALPPHAVCWAWVLKHNKLPLYMESHVDPELGPGGRIQHHHVAWNRFTLDEQRYMVENNGYDSLSYRSIPVTYVCEWLPNEPTPIVGPPLVPFLTLFGARSIWLHHILPNNINDDGRMVAHVERVYSL